MEVTVFTGRITEVGTVEEADADRIKIRAAKRRGSFSQDRPSPCQEPA